VGAREIVVEILGEDAVRVDGRERTLDARPASVELEGDRSVVDLGGRRIAVIARDAWELRSETGSPGAAVLSEVLRSPMPGIVTQVAVAAGQAVQPGDLLLVLEAMKMANEIRTDRAATVTEVLVKPGQTVSDGFGLITLG
jgi:biotin carboxyl carrier protein